MRRLLDRRWIAQRVTLAIIASILTLAARADGREVTQARSNPGGAWIMDRTGPGFGHLEFSSLEWSLTSFVDQNLSPFGTILEAPGSVLIHDEATNAILRVNEQRASVDEPVVLDEGLEVRIRAGGAAIFDPEASTLFWPDTAALSGDPTGFPLFDAEQVLGAPEPSRMVIRTLPDGTSAAALVFGAASDQRARVAFPADGSAEWVDLPAEIDPEQVTAAGDAVVIVDGVRWLIVTPEGTRELESPGVDVRHLQRPGGDRLHVGAVLEDGSWFVTRLDGSGAITNAGIDDDLIVDHPQQRPLVLDGCFYGLLDDRVNGPQLSQACWGDGFGPRVLPFDDEDDPGIPSDSHFRAVNGSVVLDELNGHARLPNDQLELVRSLERPDPDEADDADEVEDGVEVEEFDPDNPQADVTEADDVDGDDVNEAPEANDDEAGTRPGRDVFVDVLANDIDPDGDVLAVVPDSITVPAGEIGDSLEVFAAPDLSGIVVAQRTSSTPEGTITLGYEISDGRGGSATASITFTVHGSEDNLGPEAVPDRLRVWAGASLQITANLIQNDRDPEGDPLKMVSAGGPGSEVRVASQHPSGVVVLELPPVKGTYELPYVVEDDRGEQADGLLIVSVDEENESRQPDARHDQVQTAVGDRVRLDVLSNDVDPDGAPLSTLPEVRQVGGPQLGDGVEVSISEDGQFDFEPAEAGTYVFEYTVSNRQAVDTAHVRVDVVDAENRAPIAVRDDVVLGIGETRLVRVFDNDGDPDGDAVDVTFLAVDPGVDVELVPGVGMRLSIDGVGAGVAQRVRYVLSDGTLTSNEATIFVSSSGSTVDNAIPVAVDDSISVRADRSQRIFPVRNDYDPEGEPVTISDVEVLSPDNESGPGLVDAVVRGDGQWLDVTIGSLEALGGRRDFQLSYTVEDVAGARSSALVFGRVLDDDVENTGPIARPDRVVTRRDVPIEIDVLGNDSDAESDPIELVRVDPPLQGRADISDSGRIVYTPRRGETGRDSFTYTVADEFGTESTGFVTVGVIPALDQPLPPNARNDPGDGTPEADFIFEAGQGRQLLDVLRNDTDPRGEDLRIVSTTSAVSLDDLGLDTEAVAVGGPQPNHLTFDVPDALRDAVELVFDYTIENESGLTDTASVTVVIEPNLADVAPCVEPIRVPGQYRAGETVEVALTGRYSDCEPGGDPATLRVLAPTDPNATIQGNTLVVTIPPDWAGESYALDYRIQDTDEFDDAGAALVSSAAITISVTPNVAPRITRNPIVLSEPHEPGVTLTLDLAQFVIDDDGDDLVFRVENSQNTAARKLDGAADARVTSYQPLVGFSGTGWFTFTVTDNVNTPVTGRVEFTVIIPNEPPEGVNQFIEIEAGQEPGGTFELARLFTDPDLPDDTLALEIEQLGGEGVLDVTRGGDTLTLIAPASTVGSPQFPIVVTATDLEGETATATLTVTVLPSTAPPPVVVSYETELIAGESETFPVLSDSVSQLPGDPSLSLAGDPVIVEGVIGAASAGDGITVTAGDDWNGIAVVQFTVADSRGAEMPGAVQTGTITVTVIGPPDAPQQPNPTVAGPESVALTWNQPAADGGAPIVDYEVIVISAEGSRAISVGGNNPSYTVTGLTPGAEYRFAVRAQNEAEQWSVPSAESSPVRPDKRPDPPGTPTVQFIDGNPTSVQLTWAASFNEGSPLQEQQIEVGECSVDGKTVEGNVVSDVFDLDSSGVRCSFRVRSRNEAVDEAGQPLWSEWSGFSVPECAVGVPLAPPQPSAERGDLFADVAWQQPESNDCEPMQGYEIERRRNGSAEATTAVSIGQQNIRAEGLTNGESYTFRVRAESRQGWGEWSSESAPVTPCGAPKQPTSISAERGDQEATVTFSGQDPNGCAISSFEVEVNGAVRAFVGDGSGTVSGLTNGTEYRFRIRAINEIGAGEWSDLSNAVVPAGPPIPVSLTTGPGLMFSMAWVADFDGNGDEDMQFFFSGDVATARTGGQEPWEIPCSIGTACNLDDLGPLPDDCRQAAQRVSATVYAENSVGRSPSISAVYDLPGCPASAPIVTGSVSDFVSLSWTTPAGATTYFVSHDQGYRSGPSNTVINGFGLEYVPGAAYYVDACNNFGCRTSAPYYPPPPGVALALRAEQHCANVADNQIVVNVNVNAQAQSVTCLLANEVVVSATIFRSYSFAEVCGAFGESLFVVAGEARCI